MASASSMMMSASTLAGSYSQSQSINAKGEYQRQMADSKAKTFELQAKDAQDRGNQSYLEQIKKTNEIQASQKAAQAAGGADIGTGSLAIERSTTRLMGETDAATIKNNAWREAYGYQTQANNTRAEGEFAALAARNEANNTLLTGGLKAVGYGLQAVEKWPKKTTSSDPSPGGAYRQYPTSYIP